MFAPWKKSYDQPRQHIKKQKETTPEDEPSQVDRCQYATGEEQRNSSRRNEETEPKQKQCPVVDVSDGENKVRCCGVGEAC